MSREPLALEPLDYPKPHNVVGLEITVLVSREATGGHEITLQTGDRGSGPPPHSHPWDESFYVVRGAVDFTVDGKTTKAGPGAFFHLPAGTVHAFRIQENGTSMSRNNSIVRCEIAPTPADAYGSSPGRARARAISSFTDFAGSDG